MQNLNLRLMFYAISLLSTQLGFAHIATAQDSSTQIIRPAKVAVVEIQTAARQRQYPAIVQPSQEAVISFRVSGQVVELPARAAVDVDPGDVIAELDKRDFETAVARLVSERDQALAQLDALRTGARAEEIVALQASVAAAQAQVDQASDQAERTRQLAERGVVAQAKLDQDEATLTVAQANLRSAQEQLTIGQSGGRDEDIAAAEAALRGLETEIKNAKDNLADATLRAPFGGVIARRDIDNFTNVQAGQSIVLLQRLSTVHLVLDIPGSDVLSWSALDPDEIIVSIDISGGPQNLTATELVEFSTQADAGTQTYRARFAVDVPKNQRVLPGMVGHVRLLTRIKSDPLPVIPLTAIGAMADGSPIVWTVNENNAVAPQVVELGGVSGDSVTVLSGLQEGARIVTAGVSQLREGLVIRPIAKVGN